MDCDVKEGEEPAKGGEQAKGAEVKIGNRKRDRATEYEEVSIKVGSQ